MITPENWKEAFDLVREKYSGEMKLAWFEVSEDTIKNLEGEIFRNKLIDLMPLKNSKFSERRFVSILKNLNFKEDDIELILKNSIETEGNFPQFQCTDRGRDIVITPSKTDVYFEIQLKSDFEVAITTEGKFSSFKKKFTGFQDIVVGMEEFDRQFVIKGNPEDKVKKFLSSAQVRGLFKIFEPVKSITLDDLSLNIIKNITKNEILSEERITEFIDSLSLLAGFIENPEYIKYDGTVNEYKKEEVKKLSLEEKFYSLEKRVETLERLVQGLCNQGK
jgi:hypothetical protein